MTVSDIYVLQTFSEAVSRTAVLSAPSLLHIDTERRAVPLRHRSLL